MQTTNSHHLTHLLRDHMEELLLEIVEMQDYLSERHEADNRLPMGTMGSVMSRELQCEALQMVEQTEHILCNNAADSWEKSRASLYLNRKLNALSLFMKVIEQLPATSQTSHDMVETMTRRVDMQCKQIKNTLAALSTQNLAAQQ